MVAVQGVGAEGAGSQGSLSSDVRFGSKADMPTAGHGLAGVAREFGVAELKAL